MLHLVGSSILLYLIDDVWSNKNQILNQLTDFTYTSHAKKIKFPLKTKINLNNVKSFSTYGAVTIFYLGYKNQPINATQGKIVVIPEKVFTYSRNSLHFI